MQFPFAFVSRPENGPTILKRFRQYRAVLEECSTGCANKCSKESLWILKTLGDSGAHWPTSNATHDPTDKAALIADRIKTLNLGLFFHGVSALKSCLAACENGPSPCHCLRKYLETEVFPDLPPPDKAHGCKDVFARVREYYLKDKINNRLLSATDTQLLHSMTFLCSEFFFALLPSTSDDTPFSSLSCVFLQ